MIKFIADYHKLGIGFVFKKCDNCGDLKIIITYQNEKIEGFIAGETCVDSEDFKNEEKLIDELTDLVKDLINIDPSELKFEN